MACKISVPWSEVKLLSCVRLFATPWTVAYQAPPSMGFSTEEYWSGLPFPSPGDLPNLGIKAGSPTLQPDALTSEPPPSLLCPPPLPSQKKKNTKNSHFLAGEFLNQDLEISQKPGMWFLFLSVSYAWPADELTPIWNVTSGDPCLDTSCQGDVSPAALRSAIAFTLTAPCCKHILVYFFPRITVHPEIRNALLIPPLAQSLVFPRLLIHVIKINKSFGARKVRQPLDCCCQAMVPTLCWGAGRRSLGLSMGHSTLRGWGGCGKVQEFHKVEGDHMVSN